MTFLFTDVEGSTKLLHELGVEAYAEALSVHRRLIRDACAAHNGVEVDTQGDAFFFAFPTAPGALAAASELTQALASGLIQVRVGLHTGTPLLADEGYIGPDVHRVARIAAAGHGGQVLVSASTAELVELELTDLGEHRLKDLSAAERIYQLGVGEFPALKTLYRTNLPIPGTPFLGRANELNEVLSLLSGEGTRLLTLTGPGGTGKTRLALQAAADASDRYPDGVWWIPLASLRDHKLVLETAEQVVGSRYGLVEHVQDKEILCIFDSFEQVVQAGAELAGLLVVCPKLDLLVTSREPLHVTGEQEYPVPPLAHQEAVGFFIARARAVRPDFEADEDVSDICARLDDLPLALELAAARVRALSSAQILERLEQRLRLLTGGPRDLPERQRTLRATIEWSHDLLTRDEQRLFARLACFRGGSTLESAEEVTGADLDTLQSLVDKSLVRYSSERYWMLDTIREYAAEKLEASGEDEKLLRRHAEHFFALAREAESHLRSDEIDWVERLDHDYDNLRAALDRLEASGESERALQLAAAISRFWYLKGLWPEGHRRLEAALSADETPTAARAKALGEAAVMAALNRDYALGRLRAEESLALQEALGDAWSIAYARFLLGFVAVEEGDFEAALPPLEESLRLFRELGDERRIGIVTSNLAWAFDELGDAQRARTLKAENLRRARAMGDDRLTASTLSSLASDARREGRVEDALSMLKESLRLRVERHDPVHTAYALGQIAAAIAATGSPLIAIRLLACSVKLQEEIGIGLPPFEIKRRDETLAAVRVRLEGDALDGAWEEGRRLTVDEAVALALAATAAVE